MNGVISLSPQELHRSIMLGLPQALSNQEFYLCYQPIIDARNNQIKQVEVFIRWQHPILGLICPQDFIPLAHQLNIVADIDNWVLANACAQLHEWHKIGLNKASLLLNLTAPAFYQADFIERIRTTLKHYQFGSGKIQLKLSEAVLLNNVEQARQLLSLLAEHGVQIMLDNFVASPVSIKFLETLPIAAVKISCVGLEEIDGETSMLHVLKNALAICRRLQKEVYVVGVETVEQLELLHSLDCFTLQGYLFCGAVKPKLMTQMLTTGLLGG